LWHFMIFTPHGCHSEDQTTKNPNGWAYGMYWGDVHGTSRALTGNLEGKRQVGRPRLRCQDNIKIF